ETSPWSALIELQEFISLLASPRCSQDPVAGQVVSELFTNRKENINLRFSEDCLYLNIYTPADLRKRSRLPVLSPLAKNLFHRAISESGVALTSVLVKKDMKAAAKEQVSQLRESEKSCCGQSRKNRRNLDSQPPALESALFPGVKSKKFFTLDLHGDPRESSPLLPTVLDGVLLPKMPEEILAEKNFHPVPYIVGINKQECGWILPMFMGYSFSEGKLDQKTATSLVWKSYPILNIPEELTTVAADKYLGGTDDPARKKDLFLDLIADGMFGVPSVNVARHHRDAGAPTYMYEFQYRPSFSSEMKPKTVIGDHGDELFSVFGAPFLKDGASEEETNLSKMVMKFWANFARNGNPNGEGLPPWPVYDQKEGYLQIGVTTQAAEKLKDKEVAFWNELLSKEAAKKPPQLKHAEL
ncbi:liver carboxylesterase 1-like, partial [Neophocaena asiaeorientalis asiaeorientalis]|uniref:Liver carboxylesterase 1-like n=1 Tax=Neophocaena asiaeorientalis asiaeorientalis TaxID=1706337 RepID=A0A341BUF3_NEOAA